MNAPEPLNSAAPVTGAGGPSTGHAGEEPYRFLFEHNPHPMWVYDLETLRFLAVNAAAVAHYGYSREEFLAMTIKDIRPAADVPQLLEHLARARPEFEQAGVWRHRCKDGRIIQVQISSHTVEFLGRPAELILALDVTRRIEAEAAELQAAARNAALVQALGEIGYEWWPATRRIEWAGNFTGVLGYSAGEMGNTDESWTSRIHPHDLEPTLAAVAAAARGDGTLSIEYRFRHRDGTYRWMRDRGVLFTTADRQIERVIGVFTDVSARRRTDEEIRRYAERYRVLFESSPLPMWVFDVETLQFLAANEAAERHYGYTLAEFLAMKLTDVRPPEDVPKLVAHLQQAAGVGQERSRWRHRKKDGTVIEVEALSDNLEFEGRPARIVIINDVTERIRAEYEAARANRTARMLSRCNEALLHVESETTLLAEVCRIAVEVGEYRMAWVGYAKRDSEKSIAPQAFAGFEDGYLGEIRLSWSETHPLGHGPAAQAIRTGQPAVDANLAAHDQDLACHQAAARRGYRAVVCLPLTGNSETFGMLALYHAEPRRVPDEELQVLQQLAANLAFGIVTHRGRIERRRIHEAVLATARAVSASAGESFFEQLAQSMVAALGASGGYIARLFPSEAQTARILGAANGGVIEPRRDAALAGTLRDKLGHEDAIVIRDPHQQFPDLPPIPSRPIAALVAARLASPAGRMTGAIVVRFAAPLDHPAFVVSTLRIFAARAAAELEREEAEARTREQAALIDEAHDAIVVRDLEHRITFWSKGAERTYGWPAQEAIGRQFGRLLQVAEPAFSVAERSVRATGTWAGELEKVARDGRALVVNTRWTLLRDRDGRPHSILTLDTDMTERKKLEQQFLRAQRMESIGTLAGGIAHDLNNLLAPIVMGVDLLKQSMRDEVSAQIVKNIERSARRGADLVRQVLSFARGVEGSRIALHLGHVVREMESIARNTFPKNIEFEADLPADLWLVTGDPTQVNQVVLNLCVNARDAMPEGGRLAIAARNAVVDEQYAVLNRGAAAGRYVCIEVSDSGCGMSREVMDRIFEPFFTTKEVGKGTGLGLSTVIGIVRSHGGFVNVYSEAGKGSVFKVYLPAQTAGAECPPHESSPPEQLPRGNGELVLIVDDEASVRDITQQTLEAFGYRTLTAEDGAQAIGVFALHRSEVAVVLTDMMMPVMDGPALIAALRRIEPRLRVIAASGLNANGNVAKAAGAGVKHFLPKPYTAGVLLTLLRTVLHEPPPGGSNAPFS